MKQKTNRLRTSILLCGLWFNSVVWADIPITITATIIEPTCSVTDENGRSQTEVDFEDVQLVDGSSGGGGRLKSVPFVMKVTCEGTAPSGKTLKMYINPTGGTMSYAGRTVLGTSIPGLGIDLFDDHDSPIPLKTWTPVVLNSGVASATAGLVSERIADLKAGVFTSAASIVMSYQ
ncbi:fimbrial protein [Salmonella enterica subsp. enterica serovar Enteritidis]|nr:fimbrial protein [Salmonella enterica subsp. enterica serovar Enteritidis]ELC7077846.1 fimbrial protein [Salmonella enterica]